MRLLPRRATTTDTVDGHRHLPMLRAVPIILHQLGLRRLLASRSIPTWPPPISIKNTTRITRKITMAFRRLLRDHLRTPLPILVCHLMIHSAAEACLPLPRSDLNM